MRRIATRLTPLALAGGLAALAVPALAQTAAAIPDTIVTGTRVPTPQERVPAAITVLTRRDIEERGYQSLAEALTAVPGFRVAPTGGLGQQTSGFMRGASSRNVLVLLDGVPINDPSDPNGAFNFGNDLLFDVERIEVVRGPASALYGTAAIGGVVNLVTRRAPPDRQFQPYGELAGGTQNTLRGGLGATGTIGAFDYLLSGTSLSTRGFNAMAPRFETNIPERDGFRGAATTARLGWTPLDGTRVEALLRWRENRFGLDSVPQDDPNYTGEDRRWYGQLRGETKLLDGLWTTGLRIAATEDRRRYTNLPDSLSTASTNDYYRGTRTTLDWGNTVRLPDLGALTAGTVAFGVTHTGEEALSASGSSFFRTTVDANQHTTAGWTTLQYRAWDRLDVTAGLRHDAVTGIEGATTWRLGAVLALPEVSSRIRVSGGSGFAAPSLFQRYGVISGFFQGNPDLKPEHSLGWEIGAETDIAAFGIPNFAMPSFTFFQSRVRDLINYNNEFNTLVNVDRARIHGAELGLTLRPSPRLEATAAWTITEAFDEATDRRLPRRPEHVVSITARVVPLPRVVIAPTVLFTGRSPEGAFASYTNTGESVPYARSNPAGTVVNLTASWQAMEKIALFLEARNLGNSRWEPVNGFATPGRSVLVGTRFAL
ncbi:TonB-dependent receptor plug domain-containing protein [Paracraurococcus lichenis]|uniref:TonB-dependent receptor n=1 Tax=Paracraurococcus lichenis TaxID=3064888 RepID=A0ABT9E5W2_9PROT|nr:TonB-dependent receptor [Paracraurococcus sp. LOR1-02]MDO9711557.1 TonB-dependent receptor [Paracraurococcus sp. LOR1-02]